jgi:hypothetical protein
MPWTFDDDAVLTHAVAQGLSLQLLSARLRRSQSAIVARARELGLEIEADRPSLRNETR